MRRAVPLAVFWFLFFGGLGVFYPFYTLYLHENAGLGGTEVGAILAVMPLVGMVAQPFWGQLADRTGARSAVLTVVVLGAAAGSAALGVLRGFPALLLGTAAMATCSMAVVPIALSVTFAAVRGLGPHAFGLVRVWGTIGYLIGVVLFPWALHRVAPAAPGGTEPGLGAIFPITAVCAGAAALVWPWMPRGGHVSLRAPRGEWRLLLQSRPVVRLLAFSFGGHLFLQAPAALFPLFVRDHGGDLSTIGRMWVVMLLLEIPLVALSGVGLRRFGARGLLGIGMLSGGLRWTLCALIDDLGILYVVQLLHGVVVAGLLLGGPMYLEMVVPPPLRSTGQGLLAMISVGIGGIASNAAGGWLLERFGTDAPLLVGGVGALVLGVLAGWILPVPHSVDTASATAALAPIPTDAGARADAGGQ
jgi:PPP family 3-phenylpropionic acid transporter